MPWMNISTCHEYSSAPVSLRREIATLGLILLVLAGGPALAQDGATLQPGASSAALPCGMPVDITWNYAPDGPSTPAMRGYSVTIVAPVGLTFSPSDVTVFSPLGGVNDTHFVVENGPGDVTIDFAFLDPGDGLSAAADLFTVTMTPVLHGSFSVGTDAAVFRGLANQPITMTFGAPAEIDADCSAPAVPTLDPEPGFTAGTTNTLSWSDESVSGALTYNVQMSLDGSFTTIQDESGWISGLTHEFTGLADGTAYFFRVASRSGLDVSAGYSGFESSTQDDTPPVTLVGTLEATTRTVTFDVPVQFLDAGSGAGTIELFYRLSTGPWVSYGTFPGTTPLTHISFTAPGGDDTYDFRTVGLDAVGNQEADNATSESSTVLDTTGPYGTFVVNGDAPATNNTDVTLIVNAHRANEMRFSNNGADWPEGWVPVSVFHSWTLEDAEGVLTVFGEFRNGVDPDWATSDVIIYDVTAPGPVTGPDAAPAHEGVTVTWTPPGDADYDRAEIWRGLVHDGGGVSAYPDYSGVTVPVLPADRAAAVADPDWVLAGESAPQATTFFDTVTPRGIYHYTVFAMDQAGNHSASPAATARATNYVLGDIVTPVDGVMGVADLSLLGAAFGELFTDPGYNAEADFGPTADSTGTGIPLPDLVIDFEDLMIASQNYTAPGKTEPEQGSSDLSARITWRQTGESAWELVLSEPCPTLKGVRVKADLPAGVTARVEPGPALAAQDGPVFLKNIPRAGLDAGLSILGRGVGLRGSGVLMVVTLPAGASPEVFAAGRLDIELRDLSNREIAFEMSTKSTGSVPTPFRLVGAHPNPFNPKTVVSFTLPAEMDVRLEIFGLDGRRIAVLVDGTRSPGLHEVAWEGRDDNGRSVASGVYFTRLTAGSLSRVGKMTLMK